MSTRKGHSDGSAGHMPAPPKASAAPLKWLFGDQQPEVITFETGDDLVREGSSSLEDSHALLVVEGEVEERMTVYMPGQGIVEQPLFLACAGDLVNVQALVPAYRENPAICSIHAVSDGWAAKVFAGKLPPSAGLLDTMFLKTVEAMERERQMVGIYGSVVTLFQNVPDAQPFVPADPHQMMQRLLRALEERGYLAQASHGSGYVSSSGDRVRVLEDQNRRLKDKLDRNTRALSSAIGQCRTLEQKCDFEARARAALEQRMSEMMQQMVDRPEGNRLSNRFPNAVTVLESKELEELERAARHHRKLADQFENRANMLHRAIELLERDNPAMIIAEDVMMLMLGEEPPDRDAQEELSPRQTIPMLLNPGKPPAAPRPSDRQGSVSPITCPSPLTDGVEAAFDDGLNDEEFGDGDMDFIDEE